MSNLAAHLQYRQEMLKTHFLFWRFHVDGVTCFFMLGLLAFLADKVYLKYIHVHIFFRVFSITGPFVVMIYKMIAGDILTFASIYLILLFGFSLGNLLYTKFIIN